MRVLGIDPGLRNLGWGIIDVAGPRLTHVANGRLSLDRFIDLTSHGANRVFGIAGKGRMAEGYDADLTIVDLKAKHFLKHEDMATRSAWTRWRWRCRASCSCSPAPPPAPGCAARCTRCSARCTPHSPPGRARAPR